MFCKLFSLCLQTHEWNEPIWIYTDLIKDGRMYINILRDAFDSLNYADEEKKLAESAIAAINVQVVRLQYDFVTLSRQ